MGRTLGRFITLCCLITAVIFGMLWIHRARMDYNSEGRYFDEESLTVHDESAVTAYATLTLVLLVLSLLAYVSMVQCSKTQR